MPGLYPSSMRRICKELTKRRNWSKPTKDLARYQSDPVGYTSEYLGFSLTPDQSVMLRSIVTEGPRLKRLTRSERPFLRPWRRVGGMTAGPSNTAFSPAHALADPSNGLMTIYSNDMKSYGMRTGVATFLGMPRDKVRVIWMEGPQGFGRTAADDAGFEAAYLAKEIGRPVRIQWMRDEETAWDTKAPAFAVKVRGALDAAGNLVAYEYHARAADHNHVGYNEPDTVLIAQLMGSRRAKPASGSSEVPAEMYAIPNRRMSRDVVSLPARLGNAGSHGKFARSQRAAVDLRGRIFHRRTGLRRENRPR